jgi:hypothetical protein
MLLFSPNTFVFSTSKHFKIKIHKTIFAVVLYGYETWSLTLREVCRLMVFENRILRQTCATKENEKGG